MPILTKRERQDAKLALADNDRRARNLIEPGRYIDVSADATQLPTRYAVGDNTNLVINPNISGLLPGRPWNSTTSVYAILAFEPKLVFDFTGNVFKTGGGISTFSNSITHARAGNATMTDADGLLKWAPHNLLRYSEDFSNSGWIKSNNGSVVVDNAVAPDGTTTASTLTIAQFNSRIYQHVPKSYNIGEKYTFAFWVRSDTVTSIPFGIQGGINGANNTASTNTVAPVTSTWNLVEFEFTVLGNDIALYHLIGYIHQNQAQTGDVEIWHPHAYRSDLGGMVNNSAQSTGLETYVPTTSSAVYLPRVGHHIYNGNAWVNEGVLHESEARTNLCNHSDNPANWLSNPSGSFTFTAAQAVGSDGTLSLTKVAIGNTSNTPHEIYTTYSSINPSLGMTLSAELKNGNQRYVMLRQYIDANDWFAVTFDLVTGVVTQESVGSTGSVSIRSSGVIDLSNGLYRCWVSYIGIGNTSAAGFPTIDAVPSGTPTLASNGTESYSGTVGTHFYLGKMQLEQGATPSSYIPTSGSAATRAAETLTVPAANLPYNSTNMSIQIDGKITYADQDEFTAHQFMRWRASGSDFISIVGGTNTGDGLRVLFQQVAGGVNDTIPTGVVYNEGILVPFNLSSRHGSTFVNGAVDGTALTADTTVTALPDLSSTDLNLGYDFMGTIAQFRMWDEDLTDAGIVEATEPSTEPSLQLTFDGSSTNSFTVLDWSE
jgi:hypothetical protein